MSAINIHRAQVIAWARSLFELPRFYILDTETTGLDASDEVVSIGVINQDGEPVLDTLVKPVKRIPAAATAVHGITNAEVADAPTFADVYPALAALLADQVMVVYNLEFDQRMLAQTRAKHHLVEAGQPTAAYCAMKQYARFYGMVGSYGFRWHKLETACRHQGISAVGTHHAVGDCRLTLALIKAMAQAEG